jgi:DMSO/TMAO reductase YedYZ molybdopterin-dependent catalytic subunit
MDKPGRLPPGQHEVKALPVLHIGPLPRFDRATWDLEVYGEVENPLRLNYDQVRGLPKTIDESDFHCVTSWSRLGNVWEGVRFRDLAALARSKPEAQYATIECDAGYTTSLPLADLMQDDVLLAWGLDGKDLAPEHGYPLRLVVPKKYAYKSAKWVRKIKFTVEEELGYWEKRGYSDSADPWKEERYA